MIGKNGKPKQIVPDLFPVSATTKGTNPSIPHKKTVCAPVFPAVRSDPGRDRGGVPIDPGWLVP